MAGELRFDDVEWQGFINALRGRMKKVLPILKALAGTLGFKNIIQHFDDETGPNGRWAQRSPKTQALYEAIFSGRRKPPAGASRAQFNPSNKLLQMTGSMRKSVMPGKGAIKVQGSNAIVLLAGKDYSRTHDEGSGNIPQREFMWLSDGTQQTIIDKLRDEIMGEGGSGGTGAV